MELRSTVHDVDEEDVGADRPRRHRARFRIDPALLGYLMGPLAFLVILVLMHFDYVVHESAWVWLVVFLIIPTSNIVVDHVYELNMTPATLNLRIAVQVAAVTAVIYLTGWGPVLWGAYAFIALEVIARCGSRAWTSVVVWSLLGMAFGQVCIWQGWLPSNLPLAQSTALTIMGAFVLFFVIRMAGATMEQKEDAETRRPPQRGPVPVPHPELLGRDHHHRRRGHLPLPLAGRRTAARLPADELVGKPGDRLHPPRRHATTSASTLGAEFQASTGTAPCSSSAMLRRDGAARDVEAVISNQLDRASVGGYVTNVRDITERKKFEELLSHRALHDPLTGLANRQLILDRADQMLVRARRNGDPVAAFFVDLDNFKDANDSLGHEAGDRLLQAVASRLVGLLRTSDTVGRLGGDEFVILAEGVSLAAGAQAIAERIRKVLKPSFYVEGFESVPITVSASVGIAVGDRPSAQDLLRDADIALYRAKGSGRDQSIVFEESMQLAANDRLALRTELDAALLAAEFTLLYQPIFDLTDLHIEGVEALIRWNHPTKGLISPDQFIPALEDSGQIVEVGRWVLDEACAQLARWRTAGHSLTMSVNASMRQLEIRRLRGRRTDRSRHPRPGPGVPHHRDHRVGPDEGRPGHGGATGGPEGPRRADRHRRLRHRLLVARLSAPVPGGRAEDRPHLHLGDERLARRRRPRPHAGGAGSHPRAWSPWPKASSRRSRSRASATEKCDHGQGFLFSRPVPASVIEQLLAPADPAGELLSTGTHLAGSV